MERPVCSPPEVGDHGPARPTARNSTPVHELLRREVHARFSVIRPCSLPNATRLPVEARAADDRAEACSTRAATPGRIERQSRAMVRTRRARRAPPRRRRRPLSSATICGMSVIGTRRAPIRRAPRRRAAWRAHQRACCGSPGMQQRRRDHRDGHAGGGDQVARRAEAGDAERLSPRMNRMAARQVGERIAIEQRRPRRSWAPLARASAVLLEHLEHAVGDDEAAGQVDRAEHHRDEPERQLEARGRGDRAPGCRPPPRCRGSRWCPT